MKKNIIILLIVIIAINAKLGIDVSQLHSEEVLKCFINEGYSFVIARAWKSFGGYDSNAALTIANAQKVGMTDTGVYMFPCTSQTKTAESQAK